MVERIAAWLDSLIAANPDDWSVTPGDIRSGAWRTDDACKVNQLLSRTCERGTRSCEVRHDDDAGSK